MKERIPTKEKIKKLIAHLERKHKEYRKIDERNICGFSISKKKKEGKQSSHYALVFHVEKKKDEGILKKRNLIPKYISVRLRGRSIKIKTDVIETGKFRFQAGVGSVVRPVNSVTGGSVGLFVKDSSRNAYALTNFHVLANDLVRAGQYVYNNNNLNANDAIIYDGSNSLTGTFCNGRMTSKIDVALVYIPPSQYARLNHPLNIVNGTEISNVVTGNYRQNTEVIVFGCFDYNKGAIINSIYGQVYSEEFGDELTDLIAISKVTIEGDSGALLLTRDSISPIGLIIGADEINSYAIKLANVLSYFPVDVI